MWYDAYSDSLMLYARNWLGENSASDADAVRTVRLSLHPAPEPEYALK